LWKAAGFLIPLSTGERDAFHIRNPVPVTISPVFHVFHMPYYYYCIYIYYYYRMYVTEVEP
jgi:hypothetical protein